MEPSDLARSARPWLLGAMTALFVARPLFPSEAVGVHGDGMAVVMLWLVLAICWLLSQVALREFRLRFTWIDAAVVLLVGWHSAAAVWAVYNGSPRPALNMLWQWVALGLAFLLARQLVETAAERRGLVAVMIALTVGLSGYGVYQRTVEMPATRAIYKADPDAAMRQAGIWFPPGSPQRTAFEIRLEDDEPTATFALTNSLAGLLAPWLVMGVGVLAFGRWSRDPKNLWRLVLFIGCLALMAMCLVFTESRSGMLATAVGLALLVVMRQDGLWKFGWKIPAVGAVVVVIAMAAATAGGFLAPAWKSLGYRVEYWQSSMQMIADKPLLGCGPGNFQHEYTQYKLPQASEEVADPHNFIIEIWATAGTPAMLAMLAVLACFFWANLRRNDNGEEGGNGTDGTLHILGGTAAGFLLALPLGMISSAAPSYMALVLGFPLAVVCLASSYKWVVEGNMPGYLPAVGVVVLLVNLLAAGGIGFPGVAGSLWLLLALGMPRGEARRMGWPPAAVGLAVMVGLAVGCYFTGYKPVLGCRLQLQKAAGQQLDMMVNEHLALAAEADPFSPQPWRNIAIMDLARWAESQEEEDYRRFEISNAKAVELAANSSLAWRTSGDHYMEAAEKAIWPETQKAAINSAVKSYTRAVQLYPNSGRYRADLALALWKTGDIAGFRRQREMALRLDRLTPHVDKKIDEETKNKLMAAEPRK